MVRTSRRGLTVNPRLPAPPEHLRRGPFRRKAFGSKLRSPWLTSRLGLALGIAFGTCFLTGLLSHAIQHPPGWFWWPANPAGLYRVTQGLHVATGLAAIPLLAAKLWSVYPKLYAWPPARDLAHAVERLSIAILVGAALFQLVTGVLNITYWYGVMPFAFIAAHYWTAWLAIGALIVHIGVKLPIIRAALTGAGRPHAQGTGLTRRGLLGAVGATVGAVTVATVGQTVRPLTGLSVLAPRVPDLGTQGFPVNTTARTAGVTAATGPDWRLSVTGPDGRLELSLDQLAAMPQTTVRLPITCVEGWSASATWTGVRVRDLLSSVGFVDGQTAAVVQSLQRGSPYSSSVLDPPHAADPATLLALRVNGATLHPDHGYPCRLIAPNRPGVMQTKWVSSLSVLPT